MCCAGSVSVGDDVRLAVALWSEGYPYDGISRGVVQSGRTDRWGVDGKVKYGRLRRPGEESEDAVFREKLREDRVRDLGWEVVRWTWSDLQQPEVIADRLRRAFARGLRRVPELPSRIRSRFSDLPPNIRQ